MWFGSGQGALDSLQLYGKLPIAKDFLRVGAGQRSGQRVREWLDASYGASRDLDGPKLAWPARFMLVPPDGEVVQGCLWPSSDAGGLRLFPLALFVSRRRRQLQEAYDEGMRPWCSTWPLLEARFPSLLDQPDGPTLIHSLRGERIEPGRHEPWREEPVRQDVWTRALWPESGAEGHAGLVETLRRLAQARERAPRGPWRLPLVGDLPLLSQARAWITALRTLKLIPRDALPSMGLPQNDPGPGLPAFLLLSLDPFTGAHAPWFAAPTGEPVGHGDVTPPHSAHAGGAEPPAETTPPLSDSLRGAALPFGR
jgi:hypothetical protein